MKSLSIAVEYGATAPQARRDPLESPLQTPSGEWVLLTGSHRGERLIRLRARDLGEARQRYEGIKLGDPRAVVLLDIYGYSADSWRQAFDAYRQINPQWKPGGVFDTITYVGSHSGLVGLIEDVHAAGVADGVTVQGPDDWLQAFHRDTLKPWLATKAGPVRELVAS
ncbi:hypothetical protein IEU95_10350 [Hoyosella rhizosphaerae]|uniref:Uncharacterized protein n=1 Tax=Hoyosella rhizosphaerae TaxID=1755582 RepID=A0A916TYP2_9ACTN|nr:hypothetical protein [Hoyosella rhizosphaerae]MBN4927234.1 hypothetical protein [Hoyosella rhizosphaerae]GGC52917.1 hypothetical protein GCM10011410_01530 [Hoyosella rhizosphaerae]